MRRAGGLILPAFFMPAPPCIPHTLHSPVERSCGGLVMKALAREHLIADVATLERLYGRPAGASVEKEVSYIHPHYQRMIELSPFVVLATCGPGGLDTSPRGDPAGFVTVDDEKTLLIPDRRGNNRADSLRNII